MANPEADLQDLDELEEDETSLQDEPDEVPTSERRRIFTEKLDPPVSALHTSWQAGDLMLDPIFQRRKVWDDGRSSRLIESVILEVPLPLFYFAESRDGTKEVIDGQQRLNALFRFLNNDYGLAGLKSLPDLMGKRFKDLEKPVQRTIRECAVRTIIFKKESDETLRFEIFERLNTGAVPLNDQEIRNCVYRGPYNELLKRLSGNPDYMWLMGFSRPEKRFKDVEYVLRFAAFHHATYLRYRPSMAKFLTGDMVEHQQISAANATELEVAFKTATSLVRSLLGEHAFKRFYRGDVKSPGGRWEPKKFNASLYDILMGQFATVDKNLVMANLDSIREALVSLMTEDQDFIDSIELSTSSTRAVKMRFDKWRLTLESILANRVRQARCFSRELKQEMYQKSATCGLCGQHIADLDDAALDHMKMYWLGGQTVPENARLAHRFCNWARPKGQP